MAGNGRLLNGVLSGYVPGSRFQLFEGSTDRMDRGEGTPQQPPPPKPPDASTMQTGVPASDPFRFQSPGQKAYTESESYRLARPEPSPAGGSVNQPAQFAGNGFMFPSSKRRPPISTNLNAQNTYSGV